MHDVCGIDGTHSCAADLDATDLSVQDRQIGFVFQSYALFNHMTVAQNIAFGIRIRRLPVDTDARWADAACRSCANPTSADNSLATKRW